MAAFWESPAQERGPARHSLGDGWSATRSGRIGIVARGFEEPVSSEKSANRVSLLGRPIPPSERLQPGSSRQPSRKRLDCQPVPTIRRVGMGNAFTEACKENQPVESETSLARRCGRHGRTNRQSPIENSMNDLPNAIRMLAGFHPVGDMPARAKARHFPRRDPGRSEAHAHRPGPRPFLRPGPHRGFQKDALRREPRRDTGLRGCGSAARLRGLAGLLPAGPPHDAGSDALRASRLAAFPFPHVGSRSPLVTCHSPLPQ
jgi:hypothetical protein